MSFKISSMFLLLQETRKQSNVHFCREQQVSKLKAKQVEIFHILIIDKKYCVIQFFMLVLVLSSIINN